MNRFGDQLLAGAGLSGDKNRRAAGGYLRHQVEQPQHALALADDVGEAVALLQGALELLILPLQPVAGNHAGDFDEQLLVIPGLGEIIVGAGFEGVHRGFDRTVGGDQKDGSLRVALADFAQHFHSGAVRHHQVKQDQVVALRIQRAQAFGGVLRQVYAVAFQSQQRFQAFTDIGFIVDDQDVAFALPGVGAFGKGEIVGFQSDFRHRQTVAGFRSLEVTEGNSKWKRAPPPGWLKTLMAPPCS